jgi:MFS family permease
MSTEAGKAPRIFYGWWLVVISLLVQSVGFGSSLYVYSVVATPLGEAYPGGRALVMMGATGVVLCAALLSPRVGALLDRFPIKWIMIVGSIIMGLGFIWIGLSRHIWHVIVAYALFVSVGLATLSPLTCSTLLARWFSKKRGLALGIASLGTQFGGLIFPPLLANLIVLYDWRVAMLGLGAGIILIMPLLAYFLVVDRPKEKGGDHGASAESHADVSRKHEFGVTFFDLCRRRAFVLVAVAIACTSMVNVAVITNLSLFAIDLGESNESGAYLVSVFFVLGMIASPLVGHYCDILSNRLIGLVLFAISGTASVVFMLSVNYQTLMLAVLLQGFVGGGVFPLLASLVGRIFQTRIYGRVMGAMTFAMLATTAVAPVLSGWIYDITGSYRLMFLIMLLVTLVAMACLFLLRMPASNNDKIGPQLSRAAI